MPQPNPADPNDSDPLLAFFEEHQKLPEPAVAAKDPVAADDLRVRVERAERQVERALIEITTLKSDLATLVSAVEDIRKRTSRPPDKPAPRVAPSPVRKSGWSRTVAGFLLRIVT